MGTLRETYPTSTFRTLYATHYQQHKLHVCCSFKYVHVSPLVPCTDVRRHDAQLRVKGVLVGIAGSPDGGYDIALMLLGTEVANPKVIALDRSVADGVQWNKPNPLPSGYSLRVAGWGIVNVDANSRPSQLQSADVLFLNDQLCGAYTQQEFQLQKSQAQVCSNSNSGSGTCEGDSGGPLILHKGMACNMLCVACFNCRSFIMHLSTACYAYKSLLRQCYIAYAATRMAYQQSKVQVFIYYTYVGKHITEERDCVQWAYLHQKLCIAVSNVHL